MLYLRIFICVFLVFSNLSCGYSQNSTSDPIKKTDAKTLKKILDEAQKYNDKMNYQIPKPFDIHDKGTNAWVDYEKYGKFQNIGERNFRYVVDDSDALKRASGTGIYPNSQGVYKEDGYKEYLDDNKLEGNMWSFIDSGDYKADFYKWSVAKDDPGLKLYYTAYALDKSGNYKHAVKAYYACLVFFPRTVGKTQWNTPWYVAPVCIDRIKFLTNEYRDIGVRLVGAKVTIKNRFDNDPKNDEFFVNPGKLIPAKPEDFDRKALDLSKMSVKKVVGKGKVKLVQYKNNNFSLMVNNKPYVMRSICYSPSKIGLSPDNGTLNVNRDWSVSDVNNNGIIDGPYEAYVNTDRNNTIQNKIPVGDFSLLEEMGINTMRIYHYPSLNKKLLADGYENHGFMYMIGNVLGMYGVDSGAKWFEGTNYADPKQKKNMLNSVKQMVEEYKDEPYVLMWVLGNENNYGTVGIEGQFSGTCCQAQKQPDAYYAFVNEAAKLIKSLDPQQRPVAICNGDVYLLDYFAKHCPDVDIYGANAYRGEAGFGALWQDVMDMSKKPVIVTEFGCPAFAKGWSPAKAEVGQARYHKGCWNDIENNLAGVQDGVGNALGGVIFEWVDEWWKAGPPPEFDPYVHDTTSQWIGPLLDGNAYEEWFGICSAGKNGEDSPFRRELRKSYFTYRNLWKKYKNK